jgi:hypothetical protein
MSFVERVASETIEIYEKTEEWKKNGRGVSGSRFPPYALVHSSFSAVHKFQCNANVKIQPGSENDPTDIQYLQEEFVLSGAERSCLSRL